MGDCEIKCKQPASSKNIGCPYTYSRNWLNPEEIKEKVRISGNNTKMVEVIREQKQIVN